MWEWLLSILGDVAAEAGGTAAAEGAGTVLAPAAAGAAPVGTGTVLAPSASGVAAPAASMGGAGAAGGGGLQSIFGQGGPLQGLYSGGKLDVAGGVDGLVSSAKNPSLDMPNVSKVPDDLQGILRGVGGGSPKTSPAFTDAVSRATGQPGQSSMLKGWQSAAATDADGITWDSIMKAAGQVGQVKGFADRQRAARQAPRAQIQNTGGSQVLPRRPVRSTQFEPMGLRPLMGR